MLCFKGNYNMMNYEKDATEKGKSNLFWGTIFLAMVIVLDTILFLKNDEFPVAVIIFTVIWIMICSLFISSGIKLIKSGGKWKITINSHAIEWKTPNPSIDESFDFRLKEIDHIETKIRKRKSTNGSMKGKISRSYSIILNNGTIQKLNENSGVSLAQVFIELERYGVKNVVNEET
jgi:hypothetical protein